MTAFRNITPVAAPVGLDEPDYIKRLRSDAEAHKRAIAETHERIAAVLRSFEDHIAGGKR